MMFARRPHTLSRSQVSAPIGSLEQTRAWWVRLGVHATALAGYVLLAIIATYPLAFKLNEVLVGGAGKMSNDRMQNLWNLWWVQQSLTHLFTNPYHTDYLMYPQGASLYLHTLDLPLGVLSIPFQPLFGPIASYNLMIMLTLVLAGYCTFLVAREVSGSTWGGFVAGVIAVCTPLRLGDIRLGLMPMLSDFAVPLCLLFVLRTLRTRSWRDAGLAAALWVVAGLCMWYHFLNLAVALATLAVWRFVAHWRAGRGVEAWVDLRTWVMISTFCAAFALPFLLPAVREAASASYARKPDTLVWSATLDTLLPTSFGSLFGSTADDWKPGYLYAYGPLVLALAALVLVPRRSRLWATMAFVCLLFSFGPSLTVPLGASSLQIPMPYAPLRSLPAIEGLRMPGRFTYIVVLLLAIMAALAVAHILARLPRAAAAPLTLGCAALLAVETIRLPMAAVPTPIAPFYRQVAAETGDLSLVEFPFDRVGRTFLEMQAQTIHGKRILTGQTSRDIPRLPYESMPMFAQIEAADDRTDIVTLDPSQQRAMVAALHARYLVFHPDPFDSGRMEQQVATAERVLGPLTEVSSDADGRAFRLPNLDGANSTEMPLFLGRDDRWSEPEWRGTQASRWIASEGSGLWTFVPHPQRVVLDLSLYSLPGARPLEVWLNDRLVATLPVAVGLDYRRYSTRPFLLPAGSSLITLRAPQGGVSPASLGLSADTRLLSFNVRSAALQPIIDWQSSTSSGR